MDLRDMVIDFEGKLAGYSGSPGKKITVRFEVQTDEPDEILVAFRHGAGAIFQVACVEVGNDGKPTKTKPLSNVTKLPPPTKVSKLSGEVRRLPEFRGWLFDRFGREDMYLKNDNDQLSWVMETLHQHCDTPSFSGVEEDSPAGQKFMELYTEWSAEFKLP